MHETLEFHDGSSYVGAVKDGEPHGEGKHTTNDGSSIEGEFRDGKPWRCVTLFSWGGVLGYWRNGRFSDHY